MLTVGVVTDIHFVVHCIRNTDKQCWEHVTLIHLYRNPDGNGSIKIGEAINKMEGVAASVFESIFRIDRYLLRTIFVGKRRPFFINKHLQKVA